MASINFFGNINGAAHSTSPSGINHAAGSGLGFYGAGYGISVPVGQFQDTTWVTNANGTASDQYRLNNTKFISSGTVSANAGTAITNYSMPNYYAPLNIRFTHGEAVKVQNCKLRIFDRNNIQRQASGVTTMVYEVRHPNGSEAVSGLAFRGNGTNEHNWKEFDPLLVMSDLTLTSSPGLSGLNTSSADAGRPASQNGFLNYTSTDGNAHQNIRHDWYVALSAMPEEIGSKTDYGLYFTCEYL
jgi:hypothetical protein